jgi:hypothetical protein
MTKYFNCQFCGRSLICITNDYFTTHIDIWNCAKCQSTFYDNNSIGLEVELSDKIYKIYL